MAKDLISPQPVSFRFSGSENAPRSDVRRFWGHWLLLSICLISTTGCRGCQLPQLSKDEKSKSENLEKQPLARVELASLQPLPASSESEPLAMKPGHWYELHQSVRANEADESLLLSCLPIERAFPFRPIPPAGLREPIVFERRVSLARGQRKLISMEMFCPRIASGINQGKSAIRASYFPRMLGAAIREEVYPVTTMPDYQYCFVVLSQNPARYQFIGGLSSVIWPSNTRLEEERINPFRVVQIAQADGQTNLPTRLMTWTSTSHLLWNDFDASALIDRQKSSLIDWLYFGGQIIINGPESQAALKDSFLSNYLPLKNLRAGDFEQAEWQKFSRLWTIASDAEAKGHEINLPQDHAPPMIAGELASGARWVTGCEGLVAERFVGSGRVVMTTFSVGESMMIHWPSFSSFFNGALLHQPARVWQESGSIAGDMRFAGIQEGSEHDPSYVSRIRLLGRDLGRPIPSWTHSSLRGTDAFDTELTDSNQAFPRQDRTVQTVHSQGVAQIESETVLGSLARNSLQTASGIQVPRIKTIIQLLTGYLIVLVPLNWLVFRSIGRAELAWIAAPIISIIGAVVVARAVQLDIGFSRSQTTLNLFELKSGYQRGHLSSFVSLYTSLSTNYRARYVKSDGIILPMSSMEQHNRTTQHNENELRYTYADENGAGLIAFPVRSNSTRFLRGEELQDIDGSLSIAWDESDFESMRYENVSKVSLRDVKIVAKTLNGQTRSAWIGMLDKQTRSGIRLSQGIASDPTSDASEAKSESDLAFGKQLEEISDRHPLRPGEAMLLGWTDDPISQMEIEPKASQRKEATLVVVRLETIDESAVGPDLNLPTEQETTSQETLN